MAKHNELGKYGEKVAQKYLSELGFEILATNWRFGKNDELDIVALDGEFLVVVEVKTRKSRDYENPKDAVTKKKQNFLIRAANRFIEEREIENEVRFDIISIIAYPGNPEIEHIREAFLPQW